MFRDVGFRTLADAARPRGFATRYVRIESCEDRASCCAPSELPDRSFVTIRTLTADDADELTRLLLANRHVQAPYQPARPESFFTLETQRERLAAARHIYGILDGDALAGMIELSNIAGGPFQSASLGYWVDEARWGRGLATRAVAAIVELAFRELDLHRLEAATLEDNHASQRVLEKNRFHRIGLAPRYLRIAGAWRDHVLFQRTVED